MAARERRRSRARSCRRSTCQYAVRTTDEVVRTGIIAEQDGASVTLVDAKGEKTRVPRDRIESLRELPTSLMPEKLLDALTPQERRDLFRYLQAAAGSDAMSARHPPPLPLRRRRRRARRRRRVLGARRPKRKALVAITLDLEMSAEYPTRGMTEWNYRKGDLDADTKKYAVGAAKVAKDRGGLIHFFAVGRTLEQEDVGWLKDLAAAGHPVGNHTYDHVNLLGDEARGHPVPLPARPVADPRQDRRRGDRGEHRDDDRAR